jgi:hypothetical protein
MVESIADIEGCDQRWICLACKTRHRTRMTVNEPWMRHCQKYRTVLEGDQCEGIFCPGTRTGGAWFWKCRGICALKQWNAAGEKGGTLSRSNINVASQRDCPFFDHPESGCGVSLDGGPVTLEDKVAVLPLNIHAGYLRNQPWWFFCHCTPEPNWTLKSNGRCNKCGVDKYDAESKARQDGTLWQFYFQ